MGFCSSFFGKKEGITFPDNEILSILAFNGIHDGSQNTFSSFKNYFNEKFNLERDWRVALSEIICPAKKIK